MKQIRIRQEAGDDKVSTLSLLRLVASHSPHKPLTVDEIRRRVRVIDAIDNVKPDTNDGWLWLEDEDHKALVAAVEAFPWSTASHALLTVIDDVIKAEPTVKPSMKLVQE